MTNRTPHSDGADKLLTEAEACRYLRCSRSYLSRSRAEFRQTGHTSGPPYVILPVDSVRYRLSDLQQWIADCTYASR